MLTNACLRCALLLALCATTWSAAASGIAVLAQDSAGKAVADVVVYAEAEGMALAKTIRPGSIEQKGLKFVPLVTVIQTGASISFPNNDKVRHHIYSFSPIKKFDQKLYSGVAATPQVFDKPGTVVLGCNIHDKMLAYIRVVDTPYYAKTDEAGVARIDVPAGKYTLKAWHYHAVSSQAAEQVVTVKGGEALTTAAFKLALKPPGPEADVAAPDPYY